MAGVLGETSLRIHVLTGDSGWSRDCLACWFLYLYGGVSALPSVQRVVEKVKLHYRLGGEQG